jgi:hypothetical protein
MKFLREPLLHFFLLGVGIFAAYAWLNQGGGDEDIVVTRGQQNTLITTFERTWQRPPTPDEFSGLVRDFIREEIAYREAGQMELDRDDIVIRRRLRQKLELLAEDLATLAPPTEAELEAWFTENSERYRVDPRYSFEQVYFSTDRRGTAAREQAIALLAELNAGTTSIDVDAASDAITLPKRMRDAGRYEIAATFGAGFVDALAELPDGVWTGPVESGFGFHLVRIESRVASRIPDRTEVEREVLNDLQSDRRSRALDTLYETLAEKYTLSVEPLDERAE